MLFPLPQSTKLFLADNNKIIQPKISINKVSGSGNNLSSFINFDKEYIIEFSGQDTKECQVLIKNSGIKQLGTKKEGINGFDYGFETRMCNTKGPTVIFTPDIDGIDKGSNVALNAISANTYEISNYSNSLNGTLSANNLILLRNQNNTSENKIYRVVDVFGNNLILYDDSNDSYEINQKASINSVTNSINEFVFVRVKVKNGNNFNYYGYYNQGWVEQEEAIYLGATEYGYTLNEEVGDYIDYSVFSSVNISPSIGEKIAINVVGNDGLGGRTTGIYEIKNLTKDRAFIAPYYPSSIFIHQFVYILKNINNGNELEYWCVNESEIGNTAKKYGSLKFKFKKVNIDSLILNNPVTWAKQVGGDFNPPNGISIQVVPTENNFINFSNPFRLCIKAPSWAEGKIINHSLVINFNVNQLEGEEL